MENDLKRELLYIEELSLSLKRSPAAIRNMVYRKAIPYRKINGRLVFFSDEINQWMDKSPGLRLENFKK